MKKLFVKPDWDCDYAGGRTLDGYIIVDNKNDEEYYAKVWSKSLAIKVAKFLEKHV